MPGSKCESNGDVAGVCGYSVTPSCLTFATVWTVARQAPLSMGFSRREYWGGLPCPPPGHLPDAGTEPASPVFPALPADSLPLNQQGSNVAGTTVLFTVLYCEVKNVFFCVSCLCVIYMKSIIDLLQYSSI